jgi:transcriptional regulator with XRE-family HTH domain
MGVLMAKPDPLFSALRDKRLAMGLSLTEFSDRLGYDYSTVGGWERSERSPTYKALCDWCGALGVTLADAIEKTKPAKQEAFFD